MIRSGWSHVVSVLGVLVNAIVAILNISLLPWMLPVAIRPAGVVVSLSSRHASHSSECTRTQQLVVVVVAVLCSPCFFAVAVDAPSRDQDRNPPCHEIQPEQQQGHEQRRKTTTTQTLCLVQPREQASSCRPAPARTRRSPEARRQRPGLPRRLCWPSDTHSRCSNA